MANRKLTNHHKDEIFRLTANGRGASEVARILGDGATSESGDALAAVVVDESAVRYHVRSTNGQAAIRAHRERLFGDVYTEPLAWAGHRISELAELFREAKIRALKPARSRSDEAECQKWARIMINAGDSIRAEMSRIEVEAPKLSAHVHLKDKDAPELAQILGARIVEYSRAGLLDDVVKLLTDGADDDELDAEAIETTAVGARR